MKDIRFDSKIIKNFSDKDLYLYSNGNSFNYFNNNDKTTYIYAIFHKKYL